MGMESTRAQAQEAGSTRAKAPRSGGTREKGLCKMPSVSCPGPSPLCLIQDLRRDLITASGQLKLSCALDDA